MDMIHDFKLLMSMFVQLLQQRFTNLNKTGHVGAGSTP